MTNISKILLAVIATFIFSFTLGLGGSAYAKTGDACKTGGQTGVEQADGSCKVTTTTGGTNDSGVTANGTQTTEVGQLNTVLFTLVKTISWLVLGVASIVITYAGFKYATSQGEPKVTEQAKMQIVSAGIGLFISLLSLLILKVFTSVIGATDKVN